MPIRDRFPRFADLLDTAADADLFDRLRGAESIGRPLGDSGFLALVERITTRRLRPQKRGRKQRTPADETPDDLFDALSP